MVSQALIKFLSGSRFVFGSLHFTANRLDLSMHEPEQRKISGSDINQIPLTLAQNDRAPAMWPRHESDVSRESESDPSGENVNHLEPCFPKKADRIYTFASSSESNFDNDHEVFMLGQGDAPADQAEEEIAEATVVEITRSKKLAKDAQKTTRKKHAPQW
jgi:hypothetical protein